MTTTEVPMGIDDGKPSSRVLRPPGGGSSFTLGGAAEEPRPAPRQTSSQKNTTETPPVAAAPVKMIATPDNPQAEGQSPVTRQIKPSGNSHSRIFGEPEPAAPSPGRDLTKGDTKSPITGSGAAGSAEPQQQSRRVRQPPGGFSQGIF